MSKIKVFDENKTLKVLKIIVIGIVGILFIWFTFDMTGLSFGQTKLVTSAFIDEPIDFVFWLIFLALLVLFILKDTVGKYALSAFVLVWGIIQYSMYFSSTEGIANYNKFFSDTHHIIPLSDNCLVKDTYHLFLDIFIFLALAILIAFTVVSIIKSRKSKTETA